jgi:hypothetical protein
MTDSITDHRAPHETAAVLRMHRAGFSAPQICGLLKMSKHQLIHELNLAIDEEVDAHKAGLPIHDGTAKPLDASEKNAKDVAVGEVLVEHGSYVEDILASNVLVTFVLATGAKVRYAPFDKVRVAPKET